MPLYELVFITRQDLGAAEVDALTDKYKEILEKGGGKLVSREYWGLRKLAYKINKNSKGNYVLMNIETPYPALVEVERVMGFDENIIRKGIFKVEKFSEQPSKLFVSETAKEQKRA